MKLALQLAYKNLIGAGLRTWLNAIVLSFAFVIIIFFNGLMDGWNQQAKTDTVAWEYGHGQLLHSAYDPFDPFTLQDAHGPIPSNTNLSPILIRSAAIYPEGRIVPVTLKGIDNSNKTLDLPTDILKQSAAENPVIIGKRMAKSNELKKGDNVILRWRDKNGTFDAQTITIAGIFDTEVVSADKGLVWIELDKLWAMTGMQNQATMLIANDQYQHKETAGWTFKTQEELLSTIQKMIDMKKSSSSIMYVLLMAIALLAIFDTQVLSIFRRQKEIGTYVALGMTRPQVVGLFTVEGAMYSLFALVLAALYGTPLLGYLAKTGYAIGEAQQDMGIPIASRIFPVYGIPLVLWTVFFIVIAATIVSYLPARRIAKMDPVAALKGKLQ